MEEPRVKEVETVKQEQTVVDGQTAPKDQVVTSQKTVQDEYVKSPRAYKIIWYIVGLFVILIALRFVLLIAGANIESGFVGFIYGVSGVLVAPFTAIFSTGSPGGQSFFEPASIVAIVVYVLIGWGISKLIDVIRNRNHTAS